MPKRLPKPCAHPGCPNLTDGGSYCAEHIEQAQKQKAEAQAQYDKARDKRVIEFYHSPEWEAARRQVLIRDMGLCQRCFKEGRVSHADTVHHVIEVRDDWEKRLDLGNLVSVCRDCHNRAHGDKGR